MTEPAWLQRRHEHRELDQPRGDDYVINGRKWFTTGATDPRCKIIDLHGQVGSGPLTGTASSP